MQLPEIPVLNVIAQRYAEVLALLKLEPGEQPLVLPTNEWFPDRFVGDQPSFEVLVARMQGYAGLEEANIEAALVGEVVGGGACGTSGCGTGGCGTPKAEVGGPRLVALESGFRIEMPGAAMTHPIAFTAAVARALGGVRMMLAGDHSGDALRAELAATALGFGVLLFEGSYLYSKSCGGPSVGSATALSCGELALPLALFIAYEGHKVRSAMSELSTTQRAVLSDAWALVDSNRALVDDLRARPERVVSGRTELREATSWLGRLFSGRKKATPKDAAALALSALERGDSLDSVAALLEEKPEPRSPRREERGKPEDDLSSLVDEALAELRGSDGRSAAE